MNERLTLQDLVDILAQKQNISKKDAEQFLRELFGLITETISDKDYVRIKDFGTFKLVAVSSRKSVDVNSGEPIEIPPHYKLSFSPEKSFREQINSPFAHIESVLLDDQVDSSDTLDTVDVIPKVDVSNNEKVESPKIEPVNPIITEPAKSKVVESVVLEIEEEATIDDKVDTQKENRKENSIIEGIDLGDSTDENDMLVEEVNEVRSEVKMNTQNNGERKIEETAKTPVSSIENDEDIADFLKENKKSNSKGIIIGICAVVVVIIAVFFWMKNNKSPENVVAEAVNQPTENTNTGKDTESANNVVEPLVTNVDKGNADSELAKKQEAEKLAKEKAEKEKADAERKKQQEIANAPKSTTVKLGNGETLQALAKKHFGNRIFWVYIYEENTDVIKKPDAIFAGMDLKIPSASKYNIDANDKKSIERATKQQSEIFAKFAK